MNAWDFMESGQLTDESRQLLTYFMKNTTEKIFRRMNLMSVRSQSVRNSIHAVVYNNAGGNAALVRFYYINVARFIELGVGKFASDYDLGRGVGVKVTNVDIPQLRKGNYSPLTPTFQGISATGRNKVGDPIPRDKYHKARPFFLNTIRMEMRRTAERLATQCAFTHTAYLIKGMSGILALDQAEKEWRKTYGYIEVMRRQMGAMPIDIENAFNQYMVDFGGA